MMKLLRSGTARHLAAFALFLAMTAGMFTMPAQAQTTYIITDGSTVLVHTSSSTDPASVLLEAGISLGASDTITLQDTGESTEIVIRRAQLISVYYGDDLMMVGSYGETVADILERQGITLSPLDRMDCRLTDQTYDGMVIRITHIEIETVEADETIPYQTLTYEDATLDSGTEIILTEGRDGAVHTTYEVRYENGAEVSREIVSQEITARASDAVVLCSPERDAENHNIHLAATDAVDYAPAAAAAQPVLRASSPAAASYSAGAPTFSGSTITTGTGEVLSVKSVLACQATAYTCVGYTGTTATGTTARVGAIAVDPRVIPLGSRLYVVTDDGQYIYGYCTAEDTGGAIKGNIVDLYFNTWDECIQFGRRNCTVYVLE